MSQCKSLSVSLISENQMANIPIIEKLPVEIHITTETSMLTKDVIGVQMNCILDEIHFSWNQFSWGLVVKLFSSLRLCLEREIPQDIKQSAELSIQQRKKVVAGALESIKFFFFFILFHFPPSASTLFSILPSPPLSLISLLPFGCRRPLIPHLFLPS